MDRPHLGWWLAIVGGIGALAVVAVHPGAYAWWARNVTTLLSPALLQVVLVATVAIHLVEALYARRLALRIGLDAAAGGWFWQTLTLGFPSLRLLRRRARELGTA